jgi:hypothetical protein
MIFTKLTMFGVAQELLMDICEMQRLQRHLATDMQIIKNSLDVTGQSKAGGPIVLDAAEDLLRKIAIEVAAPIGDQFAAAILPLHHELRDLREIVSGSPTSPSKLTPLSLPPMKVKSLPGNTLQFISPISRSSRVTSNDQDSRVLSSGSQLEQQHSDPSVHGGLGNWAAALGGEGPLGQIAEWVHGSFASKTGGEPGIDVEPAAEKSDLLSKSSKAVQGHISRDKKFSLDSNSRSQARKTSLTVFEPIPEKPGSAVAAQLGFGAGRSPRNFVEMKPAHGSTRVHSSKDVVLDSVSAATNHATVQERKQPPALTVDVSVDYSEVSSHTGRSLRNPPRTPEVFASDLKVRNQDDMSPQRSGQPGGVKAQSQADRSKTSEGPLSGIKSGASRRASDGMSVLQNSGISNDHAELNGSLTAGIRSGARRASDGMSVLQKAGSPNDNGALTAVATQKAEPRPQSPYSLRRK